MSEPSLKIVENAFLPSAEITAVRDFSGRQNAIAQCYRALIAKGSNIAIVGNRGIGKTSLARQVENMALGDVEILDKTGIPGCEALNFLVTYYACGSGISNVDELLVRLLGVQNGFAQWIYSIPKSRRTLKALQPNLKAKIAEFGLDLGSYTSSTEESQDYISVPNTIQGVFENILSHVVEVGLANKGRDGLLIIIDEFDQIHDRTGFASFLKSLATNVPGVKFCLVGVAKDIQDLMAEHPSADRLFAGSVISLPKMSGDELRAIVANAEDKVSRNFVFDHDARERLVALAAGHPYLVHLIGKFSFRLAHSERQSIIDSAMLDRVTRTIATNQEDPVLEGRYRKAVQSSPQREAVLKALAENQDDQGEIWTTQAYPSARGQKNQNASQYVGQLVKVEYGAEIEKVRARVYRFKDSLFAAYVKFRPRIHDISNDR